MGVIVYECIVVHSYLVAILLLILGVATQIAIEGGTMNVCTISRYSSINPGTVLKRVSTLDFFGVFYSCDCILYYII